jgi:hypothetical protein
MDLCCPNCGTPLNRDHLGAFKLPSIGIRKRPYLADRTKGDPARSRTKAALLPPHTVRIIPASTKAGALVEGVAMASSRSKSRAAVRILVKTRERPRRRIRRRVDSKGSEKS